MQLPPNCDLISIPVPLPNSPLKYTNSYLLRGVRNLLIDTGFARPECEEALRASLRALDVDLNRTDFFITHHHSDHVGLAPALAGANSVIYIGRTELDWLRSYQYGMWDQFDERFRQEGFPEPALKALQSQNPARIYAPPPCERYVPVEDGQILRYGGYNLICRSMPGHTPGQLCLHLKERHTLFLGDHVLFDITPNIIAWPGVADSLGDYCRSLEQLQRYEIAFPLPGHRDVSMPLQLRVAQLLGHHQARCGEALRLLKEQPSQTAYELAGQMRWKIHSKSWETFPLAQKWFAVGETMAHVDRLAANGLVRMELKQGVRRYWAV